MIEENQIDNIVLNKDTIEEKKICSPALMRNIMTLLFLIPFLTGTLIDLYVPSLPTIANYFNVSSSMVQLTISFYILSAGLGQIALGVLSDSIGRKKILVISAIFYTASSFLAIIAPNIWILILCRLLQGIGASGLSVAIRAVATDCFTGIKLARAVNNISISWSIGPIVGPFIGGYLQHFFNWQANFYFFTIYGLLLTIYIWLAMPETNHSLQKFHHKKMLQDIKIIFSHKTFSFYVITGTLGYCLLAIFNLIGPFLVQVDLKYSVTDYGHIALALGFAYFLGSLTNRFLINYFDNLKLAFFGISTTFSASLIMLILAIFCKMNLLIIVIPAWTAFYFCGFIFPNVMAKFSSLFPHIGGTAGAISGFIICVGTFIITIYATFLSTKTQIPMVLTYVFMLVLAYTLLLICKKVEKK